MASWWIIFAISDVIIVTGHDSDGHHHGETGSFNMWRKSMCERDIDDIYEDLNRCLELDSEEMRNAWIGCLMEIYPPSNGRMAAFEHAACEDNSLFYKMGECMEQHSPPIDKHHMSEAAYACNGNVVDKYDIGELKIYFRDRDFAHK